MAQQLFSCFIFCTDIPTEKPRHLAHFFHNLGKKLPTYNYLNDSGSKNYGHHDLRKQNLKTEKTRPHHQHHHTTQCCFEIAYSQRCQALLLLLLYILVYSAKKRSKCRFLGCHPYKKGFQTLDLFFTFLCDISINSLCWRN